MEYYHYTVVKNTPPYGISPTEEQVWDLRGVYSTINPHFQLNGDESDEYPLESPWHEITVRSPNNAIMLKGAIDQSPMVHNTLVRAFIVLQTDTRNDNTGSGLRQADFMYQYITTVCGHPNVPLHSRHRIDRVIRHDIQNSDTLSYITGAFANLHDRVHNHQYPHLRLTPHGDWGWFTTILGSDNGRGVQSMLNNYAYCFENRRVATIDL